MTTDSPATLAEEPVAPAAPKQPTAAPVLQAAEPEPAPCGAAEEARAEAEQKALDCVPALRAAAARALSVQNYAEAVEAYSTAAELLEKAYGAFSPKCADVLLMYGRALYFNAVSRSSPLGENSGEETSGRALAAASSADGTSHANGSAADDATAVAAAAALQKEKSGHFVFHGDEEADEAEEEEGAEEEVEVTEEGGAKEEDGAEEAGTDDLDIAWEVLDTARVIFSRMEGEAAKKQLAETYLALGDVLLESENFSEAVADLGSALDLLQQAYGEADRKVAFCHFQLANVLEFTPDPQAGARAICEIQKAIDIFRRRIHLVKDGSLEVADKDEEVKDLEELISDMELKIEEIKTTPKEPEVTLSTPGQPAAIADLLAQGKIDANVVNDVTALVRSKVKKEDAGIIKFFEERLAAGGKKRKPEEGSSAEETKKAKESTET